MYNRHSRKHHKNHIIIRRADANGQMGEISQEENRQSKNFRPKPKTNTDREGNGEIASKIRYRENIIPMNTWQTANGAANKTRKTRHRVQKQSATCGNRFGKHEYADRPKRQTPNQNRLFYDRPEIPKLSAKGLCNTRGGGNMSQNRQHAVVRMDITLKLPETWGDITYDILELKKNPGEIKRWIGTRRTRKEEKVQDLHDPTKT